LVLKYKLQPVLVFIDAHILDKRTRLNRQLAPLKKVIPGTRRPTKLSIQDVFTIPKTTDTEPPLYNEIIFYALGHSKLKLTEH
jgi:hypothetical protein